MSKRASQSTSQSSTTKRRKGVNIGQQPITSFLGPGSSRSSVPYPTALHTGLRVYTEKEIEDAPSGMERTFRKFWNVEAERICQDKNCLKHLRTKTAIHGAINTAWIMHKSELLFVDADGVRLLAEDKYGQEESRSKLRNIDKNVDRIMETHFTVNRLYSELKEKPQPSLRAKVEKEMEKEISNLKAGQEALRKAMARCRHTLAEVAAQSRSDALIQVTRETPALSQEEVDALSEDLKSQNTDIQSNLPLILPGMEAYDSSSESD